MDEPHSNESKEVKKDDEDNYIRTKKVGKKGTRLETNNVMRTEDYSTDFEKVAPYLIELRMKKK